VDMGPTDRLEPRSSDELLRETNAAVEAAIAEAESAAHPGRPAPVSTDPSIDPGEVPPAQ
jgi:hypothetical protein